MFGGSVRKVASGNLSSQDDHVGSTYEARVIDLTFSSKLDHE